MQQKELEWLRDNPKALKSLLIRAFTEIDKNSKVEVSPVPYIVNNTHTIRFKIHNKDSHLEGTIVYKVKE